MIAVFGFFSWQKCEKRFTSGIVVFDIFGEVPNLCRPKVEMVLCYGSQFLYLSFIFSESEFLDLSSENINFSLIKFFFKLCKIIFHNLKVEFKSENDDA